jgi:hypothetical protein
MDRNDIVEYLKMVHTYYPSSIGITKDKLFLLTENITSDEWSAYKEACQTKKTIKISGQNLYQYKRSETRSNH